MFHRCRQCGTGSEIGIVIYQQIDWKVHIIHHGSAHFAQGLNFSHAMKQGDDTQVNVTVLRCRSGGMRAKQIDFLRLYAVFYGAYCFVDLDFNGSIHLCNLIHRSISI